MGYAFAMPENRKDVRQVFRVHKLSAPNDVDYEQAIDELTMFLNMKDEDAIQAAMLALEIGSRMVRDET